MLRLIIALMLGFICEPCQKGADLQAEKGVSNSKTVARIRAWHRRCAGGTQCDCQHKLGTHGK